MKEIFNNISPERKRQIRFWVAIGLTEPDPSKAALTISKYRNSLKEEEKTFVDFLMEIFFLEGEESENNLD